MRTPFGGGIKGGLYHSQSPEALFIHQAGLKVVAPVEPLRREGAAAVGAAPERPGDLLRAQAHLPRLASGEVPEGDYEVPLGQASVVREGDQLTVIAYGAMLHEAVTAAEQAAAQGVSCEVIDLRTLWPLDIDTVVASVQKTGRAMVVHEAPRTCGLGAEISA